MAELVWTKQRPDKPGWGTGVIGGEWAGPLDQPKEATP
jgi:hypothetical protein